jgi:ribosomal protein S27E
MALRVTCTACSNVVLVPATARTVACLKCGERMTLPRTEQNSVDYEVVDEPMPAKRLASYDRPRRPSRPKPEGLPKWVIPLTIALPVVMLIGGGIVWALLYGNPKKIALATKKEPAPQATEFTAPVLPQVLWEKFDAADGSFSAEFPNGPPHAVTEKEGATIVLPGLKEIADILGEGGQTPDLSKELGYESVTWSRIDPVGTFKVQMTTLPSVLGAATTLEGLVRNVKIGEQPNGSEVFSVEDCKLGGHPGKRVLTLHGTQLVDKRITKVNGRLFTVTAVVPYDPKGDTPVQKQFFAKFAIKNVPDPKPLNLPGLKLPDGFDPTKP